MANVNVRQTEQFQSILSAGSRLSPLGKVVSGLPVQPGADRDY